MKYLKKRDYVTFSLARFSASAVTGLTQGYLLIFYTTVLSITPITVGSMFLVSKIFDALIDPFIGSLIDRTRTKLGKMRPYVLFAAIPFGLISILLFIPWTGVSYNGRIAYMFITYFSYTILASLVAVPLDGIPAVASPNGDERAKIVSVSRVIGSIGEQSALVLYSLFTLFLSMKYAYMYMGIVIGVLAPLFLILGTLSLKERIQPQVNRIKFLDSFKYLFQNKQFLSLILGNFLTFFRNLVSAMIVYIVNYVYFNGSLNILFVLPESAVGLAAMLLAPKLKRKYGSRRVFFAATFFHSAALLIMFAAGFNIPWILMSALLSVAMAPVGILNVVPHLMAIDTLDYWEDKTGKRQEGITFAIVSLRSNASSAFKDFFQAWLLGYFLFATPLNSISDHTPLQLSFSVRGIFMMFTVIPAVLNLISIIPFIFYKLDNSKMKEIRERLDKNRTENASPAFKPPLEKETESI